VDSLIAQARKTNRMMRLFSQFISQDLLHSILKDAARDPAFRRKAHHRLHVRGFARLHQLFPEARPAGVVKTLNGFLTIMTDSILESRLPQ